MNIGLLCINFFPDLPGGAEYYTWNMSQELVKLGHQVKVFTQKTPKASEEKKIERGVEVNRLNFFGGCYRLKIWPGLWKRLKTAEIDVLICLDYAQPYTWEGLWVAKKRGIPFLQMINDFHSLKTGRHWFKHFWMKGYDKRIARRIFLASDKVLVRTKWTKKYLVENYQIPKDHLKVTPSGLLNEDFVKGDPNQFEKKFKIKFGKNILFLGRIRKQKGIFVLLKAFKRVQRVMPEAKLIYAGPDEKEYDGLQFTPQLKKMSESLGLRNVFFIGPVYNQDKYDTLSACQVMCQPSTFENFGQVYSQALAQGKPAIGTVGGGIPEIIAHGQDGYNIPIGDEKKLAEYLLDLLKNDEKAKEMGERGRQKVKKYIYQDLAVDLEKICVESLKIRRLG